MLIKLVGKEDKLKLEALKATHGSCHRCHEESDLNPIGLCPACNHLVEEEYQLLYTAKTMEY